MTGASEPPGRQPKDRMVLPKDLEEIKKSHTIAGPRSLTLTSSFSGSANYTCPVEGDRKNRNFGRKSEGLKTKEITADSVRKLYFFCCPEAMLTIQ